MKFQTYLFDLDGTLLDHFAAIYRSHAHTRALLGGPVPTLAEVRSAVGGGVENALERLNPGSDPARAMREYGAHWEKTMLEDVELMPGARELLEQLHARGAILAVITNKHGPSSRLVCDHLGITPLLRAVVGAKDTPWLKPQPEFTAHVLALIGATSSGTLLIGDSPYDVQTAHNAGMPAWCVTTGTHTAAELKEAGSDGIYPGMSDIARDLGL